MTTTIPMTTTTRVAAAAGCLLVALIPAAHAADTALLRLERSSAGDRNALIAAGVVLVAETEDALLAVGPPSSVESAAAAAGLAARVVDPDPEASEFALAGLRPGWSEVDLLACGEVVARGRDWLLLRGSGFAAPECRESPGWFLRILDMAPLAPTPEAPAWASRRQTPLPLVQEMVNQVDTAFVLGHWSAISESPGWTTRHSRSQGCFDAADYVHGLFSGLGLDAVLQPYRTDYAPNVIGTIPGRTIPDEVAIAIAHLDDLPSSGLAPGADDNASGTAMVTALAEIMSGYCFERTVKLIAVTG
ncbi:MAG TPA: M28 family peptidase, partial [Candidatus Sulfomarinibacteraceae bacterium]|nr:M28 family peptidase [Candidatus Sulfomarinibacteraceae bacterium]